MDGVQNSYLRVDVNRFYFTWKLVGFNKIPFISKHPILSPSFSLNDNSDILWQLAMMKEMRPKVEPKDDVLIFEKTGVKPTIIAADDAKPEKAVAFTVLKSDMDGHTWETVKYYLQIKVGDSTFRTKEKIENGESYYENYGFDFLFSSDLKGVRLFDEETLTIEAFMEHKQLDPRPLIPVTMANRKSFTENLMRLFRDQKYADIVLKAGDLEIAAHKSILSARTYGLEHHFAEAEDKENTGKFEGQTLDLDFDDESVAEAFLIYAYCGKIPEDLPVRKFPRLYAVAEQHKAEELKNLIKDCFKRHVNMHLCLNCIMENEYNPEMCLQFLSGNSDISLCQCNHEPKV